MSNSAIIVHDGEHSHRLVMTHRDWGLLFGPAFSEGPLFSSAFGVYENFTVAGGVPKGSQVTRKGIVLHNAARTLLAGIERDADLLRYDYSYGFEDERICHGGGQSIRVRGRSGILSTRPKGYCSIELFDAGAKRPRVAELIDLRIVGSIQTEGLGIVKVFRRKAEMHWLDTLPPLLEFLQPRLVIDLVVEHVQRAG
jgi:hypothetical protein